LSTEATIKAFETLGFTRVEAEVYVHLVEHSPATGYAVAKAIGRTQGAAYKTLASLEARGAVEVNGGRSRLCRAVPPAELLERLDRHFQEQKREATAALRALQPAEGDDRIYRLTTTDQVYERCRAMLAGCRTIAILDLFPMPFEILRPEIQAAADRGVSVLLMAYGPTDLPGVRVTSPLNCDDAQLRERLPLQWISVFADGRESLTGALSLDGSLVLQASWTASLLFSWGQGSYAKWALFCHDLIRLMEAGASREELMEEHRRWNEAYPSFISDGYREMKQRFALDAGERRPGGAS
jgi:HTH-type transcriptional regulator, sugar sensing transcriptional regulator